MLESSVGCDMITLKTLEDSLEEAKNDCNAREKHSVRNIEGEPSHIPGRCR